MRYGYVRAYTNNEKNEYIKEITQYGVDEILWDVVVYYFSVGRERERLVSLLKEGDEVIVRERKDIAQNYQEWANFEKRGIHIISIHSPGLCPADEFPEYLIAFHDLMVKDESDEPKFQALLESAYKKKAEFSWLKQRRKMRR